MIAFALGPKPSLLPVDKEDHSAGHDEGEAGSHSAARQVHELVQEQPASMPAAPDVTDARNRSTSPALVPLAGRIRRKRACYVPVVPHMRIGEAATFLGVSDDTVRRLVDSGALTATVDGSGRKAVDGYQLALYARAQASSAADPSGISSSARNRLVGLVTGIKSDPVMSQVELQCGPFRMVSLMSTEAVLDLELELGSVAVAVIKSTNVIVETKDAAS